MYTKQKERDMFQLKETEIIKGCFFFLRSKKESFVLNMKQKLNNINQCCLKHRKKEGG